MSQVVNNVGGETITGQADGALELRLFRVMMIAVVGSLIVSAPLQPWRVTFGLILGGGLSLLNYHWLRTSVAAIFKIDFGTVQPQVRVSSHLLRYLVIGVLVFGAYELRLVSLAATMAGLCSFVPAFLFEAFRQFYFAIINRGESY